MKIIQLSDIHLTIPNERVSGLNPHYRLQCALDDIALNHADAKRIVITGDLTHWGEPSAYQSLKTMLDAVTVPVRLLLGNHDNRENFKHVFSDHPCDDLGFINYAEQVDQYRFIYLDTNEAKTHVGHFCESRRAWLESQFEDDFQCRLFVHHNLMPIGIPSMDRIGLNEEDRAALHLILNRYQDRIDYIHFGHIHTSISGMYCGIPYNCIPSTVIQSYPEMKNDQIMTSAYLEPSYNVIQIGPESTNILQIPYLHQGPIMEDGIGWDDWSKTSD